MQEPTSEKTDVSMEVNGKEETYPKTAPYLWASLYERWGKSLEIASHHVADLAELVKTFTQQINRANALDAERQKEMTLKLEKVVNDAVNRIGETVDKAASYEIATVISQLQMAIKKSEVHLRHYKRESIVARGLYGAGVFLMALVMGIGVAKTLMPLPYLPLTGEQLQTYNNGKMLEAVWPLLPDREKKHLANLAGRIPYSLPG